MYIMQKKFLSLNIDKEYCYYTEEGKYYPSHYAKKVGNEWYLKNTLTDGAVSENSVKLTEKLENPHIDEWEINKKIKLIKNAPMSTIK